MVLSESNQMKKLLFIIVVLAILVSYFFGSANNFGYIELPEYVKKDIDILGGMSTEKWETDKAAREERLKELVRADYQPISTGYHFGGESSYHKTHVLSAENYQEIVEKEPKLARKLPVRDPEGILDLAAMNYIVRDSIIDGKGNLVVSSGSVLSKEVLDRLEGLGFTRIRVVGTGGVVSIESGTMVLVPLIFLALLAALKLIMFDPLVKIMDERSEEIVAGVEQAKVNKVEIAKLDSESKDKFDDLRREYVLTLGKAKHKIALEAEKTIQNATDKAHAIREEAHKELAEKIKEVEAELKGNVDELAKQIVAQVISGGKA